MAALRLKDIKDGHAAIYEESAQNVLDARSLVKENKSPTTVNTASRSLVAHSVMIAATMNHGLYDSDTAGEEGAA